MPAYGPISVATMRLAVGQVMQPHHYSAQVGFAMNISF
jgi:hypothetical protein